MLNTNRYRSRRQNDYGSRFVKIAFGGMTRTVGRLLPEMFFFSKDLDPHANEDPKVSKESIFNNRERENRQRSQYISKN